MPYKELPHITFKQMDIVDLVYKFRFVNRKQIQQVMKHKDSKRINVWLKDLVEKKYLGRIYSKKLLENTKPAIYYLDTHGILWVRSNKGVEYRHPNEELDFKSVKKFYEDKHASETFRNHCITLCDIYLQLKGLEETPTYDYIYLTKTELWIMAQGQGDLVEVKNCIPHLYIEKMDEDGKLSIRCWELFDSYVPMYALRYKVQQYIQVRENDTANSFLGFDTTSSTIILILPNQPKLNRLSRYIQEQLEEAYAVEDLVFLLTTYEKVMKYGIKADIWKTIQIQA